MIRGPSTAPRRRGFTLIELMVAMAISMALLIVVAELFIQTRRNYAVQDDQARLQENTRYIVQTITRVVRQSAWRSNPGVDSTQLFDSTSPAITGTEGTGTTPDSITLRFRGSGKSDGTSDASVFDCLGNSYTFNQTAISTFSIRTGTDGNGLFCTTVASPGATDWQELVPGVENMQILYGLDTDATLDKSANAYEPISAITGTANNNVVSARFSLLLRTPTDTNYTTDSKAFTLNGVSIAAANDKRLRRVVNFTVSLRNRTP